MLKRISLVIYTCVLVNFVMKCADRLKTLGRPAKRVLLYFEAGRYYIIGEDTPEDWNILNRITRPGSLNKYTVSSVPPEELGTHFAPILPISVACFNMQVLTPTMYDICYKAPMELANKSTDIYYRYKGTIKLRRVAARTRLQKVPVTKSLVRDILKNGETPEWVNDLAKLPAIKTTSIRS